MGLNLVGRLAAAVLTLGAVASAGQTVAQTYTSRVEKVVTYTANGQVQTEADGKNNLTTYEYDGFDRLVKVRYPDPNTPGVSSTTDYEQYGYDAAGNRTSWRRRSGETVAFTYDALNRAMSGLRGEAYTYDNLGRRTDAAYNGYTHQAAYDALGRTTLERTNTLTVSYEYDLAGRRTKITWPDGVFARYDRHVTGEVSTIHENGLNLLASYAYDDLGRVASRTYANGTDTSYGYDAASRLAQLNLNVAGTDKDQAWTFAYNAAGQVITRTAANGLYEWTQSQASKTYGVNGLNQLTSAGGAAVSYDLRGNLSLNGGVTHGYDLANNLTATSGGAVLAYEPTGRLWQVSAGGATTQFLYAGSDLIAEYGPGGLLRRYVPGDGVDQPLVWYEGAGLSDRRFLLQDAQGSVAAVTNGAGAATINSYDEYGVPAATNQGRFQYTGQIWMSEVGLYHYKARAYSPTLGRFLQTDPIGYRDGLNWYAYIGNDPLNGRDPTGTDAVSEVVVTASRRAWAMAEDLARENLWRGVARGATWGGGAVFDGLRLAFDPTIEPLADGTLCQGDLACNLAHFATPYHPDDDELNDLEGRAAAADKNGFTVAGRSYQKHSDRPPGFPKPSKGNPQSYNVLGGKMVTKILRDAGSTYSKTSGGDIIGRAPDGTTFIWRSGGTPGFLNP